MSETRISKLVSRAAEACEMKNWHHVTMPYNETFENYFGELVPVTIEEKERTVKVLIKFAPVIHELRGCGVVHRVYCKEIYVYSNLKREFESLAASENISLFMPKCYYADNTDHEEVLVLQDMRSMGFERYDNGLFMDIDHVKVSLETLAKFHAFSFILQERNKEAFDVHKEALQPFGIDDTEKYSAFIKNAMRNLMFMFKETRYEMDIRCLYDKFDSTWCNEVDIANRLVFGHGDVWKENILFHYEDGKPKQACLIDYQLTRLMNPAYDVLFLLLNATDGPTRRQHFHEFLYSYYDTLQKVLKDNNLDGTVYSKNDFQEDLKSISPVCFSLVQSSFSLWLGLESNSILSSKHVCSDERERESKKSLYKKIILDILDDFKVFGYL